MAIKKGFGGFRMAFRPTTSETGALCRLVFILFPI
jgi:hypothetical protein